MTMLNQTGALKKSHRHATYTEGFLPGVLMFIREFCAAAFSPYRPDRHYMRGPGPAWHAKHDRPAEH